MEDKELLKQYMLFAGVNASQLAEEIEVSKQYILNLRNGQFKVSAIFAKKLEKVNKEAYSENENTKLKAKLFDMSENLATYMMDNTELKKKVYELQKEINSIEESR